MDDSVPILEYLPNTFKNKSESDYLAFLWETFESNYKNGKYQFAILAYHMLYISFVYFSVWQIKNSRPVDFGNSLIGFSKDEEKSLLTASSPFAFWTIKEARIFRFLKLVGCENEAVGKFSKLVQQRNDIAHSNGNIFYNDSASADQKLVEVLVQVDAIQQCMTSVIHDCLCRFLLDSWDEDKREYYETTDQIREVLIHPNYFSQKDIEACLTFDIERLSGHENFLEIKKLFDTLKKKAEADYSLKGLLDELDNENR